LANEKTFKPSKNCVAALLKIPYLALNCSVIISKRASIETNMRTRGFRSKPEIVVVAIFLLSFSVVFAISDRSVTAQANLAPHVDLHDVNVAIYNGAGGLASSAIALQHLFLWMNATVRFVDGAGIRNGTLSTCDILAFPGGSMLSYRDNLESEGLDIVREFVRDGGSYFGICGGALFGTDIFLDLFNGTYSNPINGTGIYLTQMYVNRNSSGPDLSSEPDSYDVMYWGSSYFYGDGMSTAIPIANYSYNNKPGMIALTYGEGTAFLSSPHPEYEEGNIRDGTDFCDYLNDTDTEWLLLLKVSCWLVDASITQNTTTGIQLPDNIVLISLGGAGLLGVAIVVYLMKFRTR
jgi:glutamine amidotransferase-like uncharacterized protein